MATKKWAMAESDVGMISLGNADMKNAVGPEMNFGRCEEHPQY
jgi:hypothetical protein